MKPALYVTLSLTLSLALVAQARARELTAEEWIKRLEERRASCGQSLDYSGHGDQYSQLEEQGLRSEVGARVVVDVMVYLLEDPDLYARQAAVRLLQTLAAHGVGLRSATEPLSRIALEGKDQSIRDGAGRALGGIGPGAARILRDKLNDPSPTVRFRAARALGNMGASEARPDLDLAAMRFPRYRASCPRRQWVQIAGAAIVPVTLVSCAAWRVLSDDPMAAAGYYLPERILESWLIPLPVTIVGSLSFCCLLAAIWICQRKPLAPSADVAQH